MIKTQFMTKMKLLYVANKKDGKKSTIKSSTKYSRNRTC